MERIGFRSTRAYIGMLPVALSLAAACAQGGDAAGSPDAGQTARSVPAADFMLTANRWSATIPAAIRVPSGSVIEAFTMEA